MNVFFLLPHLALCVFQLFLFVGEPLTGGEMGIVLVWRWDRAPAFQGSPLNKYYLCSCTHLGQWSRDLGARTLKWCYRRYIWGDEGQLSVLVSFL